MYIRLILLVVGALLLPGVVWAQALQEDSFQQLMNNEHYTEALMVRCDNSLNIADPGVVNNRDMTYVGGVACTSGDWTPALDCRGKPNLTAWFYEYGAGAGVAKIWDCLRIPSPLSSAPSTLGGVIPAVEAPGTAFDATSYADPDPLCVSIDDAETVVLDGVVIQRMATDPHSYHFIVGEIETCTGNCDSTLVVSCGR